MRWIQHFYRRTYGIPTSPGGMPKTRRVVAYALAALFATISHSALTMDVPSASGEPIENPIVVTKDKGGPKANAVTRTFVSDFLGLWRSYVENDGLMTLTVDVRDVTMGVSEEVMHIRIKFSESGAYPTGSVDPPDVIMGKGRPYEIALTPNGPRGGQAEFLNMLNRITDSAKGGGV